MNLFRRRNILLLLASATVFAVSCMCASGAPQAGAPAPAATPVSITALPFIIEPIATTTSAAEPAPISPPPAIPESRRLTLEYPPKIRTGDSDVIRLTLEVDTLGNITPTAEIQGNLVTGQTVQIPNLYDTHNVIAEARLDLAGPEVRPSEAISEPLLPGQSVTFYWSVHPTESGIYRGTAWLFLRFIDKVSGAESRKALAAQTVQIEATSFFGLTGNVARAAGGVGSIVGAVLGFPFAGDVIKWLLSRLRR